MRESERNKRSLIIVGLCSIVLIMAVGFAAFSQQLQINSTSEVTSSWDIEITDIKGANPSGGDAYDVTPPTYTPTTATFSTGLVSPRDWTNDTGSFRLYQVEVSNLGTLTGQVSVASLSCGNNPAIMCQVVEADDKFIDINGDWVDDWPENVIDINEGHNTYNDIEFTLEPTEKHYIEIYVWYSEDVETQPASLSADISLTLTYVQAVQPVPPAPRVPYTGTIYRVFGNRWTDNVTDISNEDYYTTSQEGIQSSNDFYLKHTIVNDIVTESYVCFVTDTEHCLRGGVDECEWDDDANNGEGACTFSGTPTIFNDNTLVIQGYQSYYNIDDSECVYNNYRSSCRSLADINGNVSKEDSFIRCEISNGVSGCWAQLD